MTDIASLQKEWRKNLDALPSTPNNIPAFFFGHGSPILAFPANNDKDFFGGGLIA
jgi:4,5-DOPA dioxygenase extradiol